MIIFNILLLFSLFALVYSYFLYPLLLKIISSFNLGNQSISIDNHIDIKYKDINIIIPVHNEESIIGSKLKSIVNQNYPKEKIKIYIGLDACTDNSIKEIEYIDSQLNIIKFESKTRIGKPKLLNHLFELIQDEESIILVTDADILLETNTLIDISKSFDNELNILTDLKLINKNIEAIEENLYLDLENTIKSCESKHFHIFQGVSGACYAIKRKYFKPIPENFLVDDFYISIQALMQQPFATFLENSFVYENRPKDMSLEFKRKIRIATGNFQNLYFFGTKLLNPISAIGFTFISHKLFRWLTPFFMLYISIYLLINYTFIILALTLILLSIVFFLSIFEVKKFVRIPFYFIAMQIAVLIGFYRFLKGVKTNIWQPTNRI